jgi:hypothetical protein
MNDVVAGRHLLTGEVRTALRDDLTQRAFEILMRNLRRFGNDPGPLQQEALMALLRSFTDLAIGRIKGRHAYPLATGLGKTQAVVAWAAALHELRYDDLSLAVSANQVEALCQLKRDMLANGVPDEKIGLLHSYPYEAGKEKEDGFASLPCTRENEDKPIMLVTHQRIKGSQTRNNLQQFANYQGAPRSLLIWDESLVRCEARAISKIDIERALGWLKPSHKAHALVPYFEQLLGLLDAELARQRNGEKPKPVDIPAVRWDKAAEFKKTLGLDTILQPLQNFLDILSEQLRVLGVGRQGDGIVMYDVALPPELKTVAVLDASYPVRELTRLDASIIDESFRFPADVKRYENVTVHHLPYASGRDAMEKLFKRDKREERKVSAEVAALVKTLSPDDGVLVFTFKTRQKASKRSFKPVDFQGILRRDLEAAGIDLEQTIPVDNEQRPRFVFLTWGNETSLSKFAYCEHVVFAGVLHRSNLDIASYVLGQRDDLWHPATVEEINNALIAEVAHVVYQAMSRGSCRKVVGNQAAKMNAWLLYPKRDFDKLKARLSAAMPGLQWTAWKAQHLKHEGKLEAAVSLILNALEAVPASMPKVSTKRLKAASPILAEIPESTFLRAAHAISEQDACWEYARGSFVRKDAFEAYFSN